MVGLDGFIVSHSLEDIHVLEDQTVKGFVKTRQFPSVLTHEGKTAPFKLDPDMPMTMGPMALPNYYFEFKRQQEEAMKNALEVIRQVHAEYAALTGRSYGDGLLETYKLEDAEIAVVCIGSTAGTIKAVVDELRNEGIKAGLLRIRTYRPLPAKEIADALKTAKAVAVMDRSMSFGGQGGAVFHEVRHVLYDSPAHPQTVNYIYGLGGRDTSPAQIREVFKDLQRILQSKHVGELVRYIGLRE
jgi:pyruvate ferredoxin oxidoreductase alpha subunit